MKFKNTEPKKNAWMLSFIDLLSILLAFFILFYSLSGDLKKVQNDPNIDSIISEEDLDSHFQNLSSYNKSSHNKLIELNYLKKLIESKIIQSNININYQITLINNELNILLYKEDIFNGENLNNSAQNFFTSISEILTNIDNQIYIAYYYTKDINSAFNKLLKIQYILEKNGYKYDIISYANYIKDTEDHFSSQEYLIMSIKDIRITNN